MAPLGRRGCGGGCGGRRGGRRLEARHHRPDQLEAAEALELADLRDQDAHDRAAVRRDRDRAEPDTDVVDDTIGDEQLARATGRRAAIDDLEALRRLGGDRVEELILGRGVRADNDDDELRSILAPGILLRDRHALRRIRGERPALRGLDLECAEIVRLEGRLRRRVRRHHARQDDDLPDRAHGTTVSRHEASNHEDKEQARQACRIAIATGGSCCRSACACQARALAVACVSVSAETRDGRVARRWFVGRVRVGM